jgi:hypothetical protein
MGSERTGQYPYLPVMLLVTHETLVIDKYVLMIGYNDIRES